MNQSGRDIQERCFAFACRVVALNDELYTRGASARQIGSQLLRSGTSIGANVEEADAAQSRADFISKLTIGLKEARESLYWLRLLDRTGKLQPQDDPLTLLTNADRLTAILTTIVKNTRANTKRERTSV